MTEQALYLKDCYLKEWDSEVKSSQMKAAAEKDSLEQPDKAVKTPLSQFIVLDRTAFYPQSGGQPFDTGTMTRLADGKTFRVVYVGKFGENISHEVEPMELGAGLKAGDKVRCKLDWERRYTFMRYHTADHVFTRVIINETGAKITGNQISMDKSRIDFDMENFDRAAFERYAETANGIIAKNIPINKYFMPREQALKNPELFQLRDKLPPDVMELRIVQIGGDEKGLGAFDTSACGGTHLNNTSEIGRIKVTDAINKGKNNRRIYFVLE